MTFANVSVDQTHLALLSQLQLSAFPGCTIHQSRNPIQTIQRLSFRKIDAVFMDADSCFDWLHMLKTHNPSPPVYLLYQQDLLPSNTPEGIQGIVTYPLTMQKIQFALQRVSQEIKEVV